MSIDFGLIFNRLFLKLNSSFLKLTNCRFSPIIVSSSPQGKSPIIVEEFIEYTLIK